MIDIEFQSDSGVRDAWKELNDLLSNFKSTQNAGEKADDLNAALLVVMGKSLGYRFDKVYLKRGAYYPEFLNNVEIEQHSLRQRFLELLDGTGRRKIPVALFEQRFPDLVEEERKKSGRSAQNNVD